MTDKRPLIGIILILLIVFIPLSMQQRPEPDAITADSLAADAPVVEQGGPPPLAPVVSPIYGDSTDIAAETVAEDTIRVRSALYEYDFSTLGGRIIGARMLRYTTMVEGDTLSTGARDTLTLFNPGDAMLGGGRLQIGREVVEIDRAVLEAEAATLTVSDGPAVLRFTGSARGLPVTISYTFVPDDYRIRFDVEVAGVGANGGTVLLGMGSGFRDTEANRAENDRERGVVTKLDGTDLTRFGSIDPGATETLSGPFEWVAVKSKYFVAGFFAWDSTRTDGAMGLIGGVEAARQTDVRADVSLSLPVPASGRYSGVLYLGPMEYDRLTAMGREFDDVNPYGWPGMRTLIRPFAVAIRATFVWMHQVLGVHYGIAIVIFGVLIRLLLWPLNQKAMRSMTAMQAVQPELQRIQEQYKQDPQRLQQEMMRVYREHKINPFGGCWPMLLPWPFLVAVFFVLQNTIELRGVSFLWMPDLSRADPLYIIPVFMAISMFALSKIGQSGMTPNPQMKFMLYAMPLMFGVMFMNFASGLNLYYAVQNVAALPQQILINRERRRLLPNLAQQVNTGPPPPANRAARRRGE